MQGRTAFSGPPHVNPFGPIRVSFHYCFLRDCSRGPRPSFGTNLRIFSHRSIPGLHELFQALRRWVLTARLYHLFLSVSAHARHMMQAPFVTLSLSRSRNKFFLLSAMPLLWCEFGEFSIRSTFYPLYDILLYSYHLSAWYCIDIVRRNFISVTHGS